MKFYFTHTLVQTTTMQWILLINKSVLMERIFPFYASGSLHETKGQNKSSECLLTACFLLEETMACKQTEKVQG